MGNEFHELAQIKSNAEDRIFQRIDFGLRAAKLIYCLVAAIIGAAIWLTLLESKVDYNNRAIGKLWQTVYNYPLP